MLRYSSKKNTHAKVFVSFTANLNVTGEYKYIIGQKYNSNNNKKKRRGEKKKERYELRRRF